MVFKRPKFFLDLGGGEGNQPPAVVAPPRAEAKPAPKAAAETAEAKPASTPAASAAAEATPQPVSGLTTAEAIAAELAAAEALRPAPSMATFAPDCVTAGGATPMKRRTPGANLAVFKEMAAGMMRS
ncbi:MULTISPECIES: hypothetical protein [Cyanophyceae]|jgi:hypothetical protein|uniref:Translation initiation factor 2 n=1 Tax=Aphanothece cf. minutissima CCALA 015 TaxID=2107695 RepID=A0ABX5FAJ3_9CHRO|nr:MULTISPECIES: hypothetical protein [Cyanophyceae]MCP9796041.1 hypothetical protein [Cyanobium sp. Lug-B]PSB38824.1 hypothetical protein C7B81_04550 [Aphanothece cf. minutissima CCALA 015]